VEKEEKLKSFKLPNRNTWAKGQLRRASLKWPAKEEAFRRSRTERGVYECNWCKRGFSRQEVVADHINPVRALDSDKELNWNDFIQNLLCDVEGYQIMCKPCHELKTKTEVKIRTSYRQEKKKEQE
jgi:hypothetical protein